LNFSANIHFFLFSWTGTKRKNNRKHRETRERDLREKGVTICWEFGANFTIFGEVYPGIWPFKNFENPPRFLAIPRFSFSILDIFICYSSCGDESTRAAAELRSSSRIR